MSRYTLSRIPTDVQHIFRIYVNSSQINSPVSETIVADFVQKSSSQYQQFNRYKLQSKPADGDGLVFNPRDFDPVVSKIISHAFKEIPNLELCQEQQLYDFVLSKYPSHTPSLHTSSLHTSSLHTSSPSLSSNYPSKPLIGTQRYTSKSFTDYQARVASTLANFYSPRSTVPQPMENSFSWYLRLLKDTPVVIFLAQKQRLMSEPSLSEINKPLESLRLRLAETRCRYSTDLSVAKRVRNYHLADLTSTDLFALAVEWIHGKCQGVLGQDAEQGPELELKLELKLGPVPETSINAPETISEPEKTDFLANFLLQLPKPTVTKNGNPLELEELQKSKIRKNYPFGKISQLMKNEQSRSKFSEIFPYDIEYNDLFMVTIERPIIEDDHSEVLKILENCLLDIVAIRMKSEYLSGTDQYELSPPSNGTYDQILEWIRKKRNSSGNNISTMLSKFGQWGLVHVEDNSDGSAFYLHR